MGLSRSPMKVAPIFNTAKLSTKRKTSGEVEIGVQTPNDLSSHAEPKRMCLNSEGDNGEVTNSMILQAITSLTNTMDCIETKLATMVDSKVAVVERRILEHVSQVTKTFQITVQSLEENVDKRLDKMEKDLKTTQNKADAATYQSSSTEHGGTESRIDLLERQARSCELVMSGVPKVENENLSKIFHDVCKAIDFNGENCVQQCFRLPQRNSERSTANSNRRRTPSIILKFWSGEAKTDFFKQYIRKNSLCVTNIGFSAPARIYVNENLTKKNFEIFQLARQVKADGGIYQFNTYSGRVFIKLAADAQHIGIDSKNQLYSLIGNDAAQRN